ncbi:MAG: hypothetical protein ACYS76_07855 [Planctomycetota bacterium]
MKRDDAPLVLGAGPTGLVAAYLLDATLAIGEKVGGGNLRRYAPMIFRRTDATEEFLADLDLPFEPRIGRIGYLGDDGVRTEANEVDRLEYFRRSRGFESAVPRKFLTETEVPTFDVSLDELVEALLGLVEVRRSVIRGIAIEGDGLGRKAPKVRIVCDDFELLSGRVVNTLPAPEFDRLLLGREKLRHFRPSPNEWRAGRKTFHRVALDAVDEVLRCAHAAGYDHLYVVARDRARYPFDRVNFVRETGEVLAVLEFDGGELPAGAWATHGALTGDFLPLGTARDPVEFGGSVRHLGRLARWRSDVRLHHVVEEIYDA